MVKVDLAPNSFRSNFDKIASAITPRIWVIIIDSPHDPSATIWTRDDMLKLHNLLAPTEVLLIKDEVYEHVVFDTDKGTGQVHHSAVSFPALAARALIVSRVGNTYHVAD